MSNFLKNLAKRAAGLPLSTEGLLTPGSAIERSFRSSETLQEIAIEDSTNISPQVPLAVAGQPPMMAALSTPSSPDVVQRSALQANSPISPPGASQSSRPPTGSMSISSESVTFTEPTSSNDANKTETSDRIPAIRQPPLNNAALPSVAESAIRLRSSLDENDLLVPATQQSESKELLPTDLLVKPTNQRSQHRATKPDQVIRPAVVERDIQFQFPKVVPVTPQSPGTVPIHVRVGRVEVRGSPPLEPARPAPKERAPLGFAAYQRVRRYRI